MKSLRRRLMVSLWIAITLVAVLSAAFAYVQVSNRAKDLLDGQLQQIAGLLSSQRAGTSSARGSNDSDVEVAIWDATGALRYSSSPSMAHQHGSGPGFSEIILDAEPYRLYTASVNGDHIEVAQPVDVRDDQAEAAALAALLPALVLLPVLWIVIAIVIRTLLRPVRDLASAVSRRDTFSSEALSSQGLPKEVTPLVDEINRLLARQNEAAQRERHFVDDAAHALRTPLAALQLQADVLDGSPEPAERSARLADLRAGIQRASRLSQQLLSLARAESANKDPPRGANVDEALRQVHAFYATTEIAAVTTLDLETRTQANVRGDSRDLLLIFSNLVDNALRYTQPGGRVEMRADTDEGEVRVEVWDEGPGLPHSELTRVFERFYQTPGDSKAGSGLGLATVDAVVRRLGGRVALHNRADRSGLIARVVLPRMDPVPPAGDQKR
jgi:two-component system OmpR family sensor kinase